MGRTEPGQQGNRAKGIMFRVPDSPGCRQGEDSVRAGFQRAEGPVGRREKRKLSALLEAGRKDNKNQVRREAAFRLPNMIQVSAVERIVFSYDAENLHAEHPQLSMQNAECIMQNERTGT